MRTGVWQPLRGFVANSLTDGLDAWREARAQPHPVADWLALGGVVATLLFLAAVIMLSPPFQPTRQFEEGGAVTVMSAMLLAASAAFAFTAFYVRVRDRDLHALFWLFAALGFAFLSLGELLQFHERVGDFISDKYGDSRVFRNWNDLIVILYGVAAVGFGLFFLPEVIRYGRMMQILAVAFFFYVLHTVIDSLAKTSTPLSMICEESAKLVAVTLIAAGMAAGLMAIIDRAIARP